MGQQRSHSELFVVCTEWQLVQTGYEYMTVVRFSIITSQKVGHKVRHTHTAPVCARHDIMYQVIYRIVSDGLAVGDERQKATLRCTSMR